MCKVGDLLTSVQILMNQIRGHGIDQAGVEQIARDVRAINSIAYCDLCRSYMPSPFVYVYIRSRIDWFFDV